MTSLARYPQYKPIDARWLREIPASWKSVRLRYLCDIGTGSGDTQDADPEGPFPFVVRSPTPLRSSTYSYDTEAILTAGDGALVGKAFLHLNGKFHAHQRVYVLTRFKNIDTRFLYYYFSSHFWQMASDGSAKTTVDSVRRWMLTDMPVAVPPASGQAAIVRFLDRETAEIDALIARQSLLIDTLRERRIAVITATALGAGSEWDPHKRDLRRWGTSLAVESALAARPPHWRLERFKSVCHAREERNSLANEVMLSLTIAGQLVDRAEAGGRQEPAEENIPRYFVAHPDDLVVNPMWLTGGSIGVTDKRGAVSPDYRVFRLHPDINPWYLHAVLRSTPYFDQYKLYTRSSTTFDRRIKQVDLDNLPLPVPPIEEQRKIIDQIDEQAAKIDALIAKTRQHIEFAKERRAALISAAVTGQIDVTGRSAAS
jgi:type I restriction enzyme S subunit